MADNAKIVLNVGMDRKDFFNGAKDIQNAIKALQTSVVSMGREIRTAAGGYGTAMLQSAKASRDFEGSIQNIKNEMSNLQGSITAIKGVADNFNNLKDRIDISKNALAELIKKKTELEKNGGKYAAEWKQNESNIHSATEAFEQYRKKYDVAAEEALHLKQAILSGKNAMGSPLTKDQLADYKGAHKEWAAQANDAYANMKQLEAEVRTYEQIRDRLTAEGKNQPSQEWTQTEQQIIETVNAITAMQTQLDNMRKKGYENADQSDEYKDQVQKLKELQAALERTRQVKDEALKPPYIRDWENMTRLSAMVTEGFGRIQYAAGTLKTAIQHPIQAADRALGNLIASAGHAASSLARMAGNGAMTFLRDLASTARNAAIQLAKLVSNAVTSGLGRLASAAKNAVVQLAKLASGAIRTGVSKLGSAIGQASKRLLGLDKSARRANKGLSTSLKTILKYAFGVRSMYFLFRRLRQAFMDGIKEIAKQNPELQASLNSLSKSFSALKGSIAAAFAPIVTVVAPALTMLMNLLAGAMNSVGAFFAALTGKKTYQTSVGKVGTDAKKSSKDVKELNRQLASFDHLNILTDKKDNDNSKDSGLAYKTVPIPNAIKDFVDQLKALWNAEDFEGIGALFAEKINGIFEKIDKAISWDNVGAKITKAVKAITGILNGLIYNIKWRLIGKTVGDGINTLVKTFNLFATGINWVALGKGLAEGLNSLISTVDWGELGQALANRVNIVIWTLYGVISNFDFASAGTAFAEMVTSIFNYIDWDLLAQTLYKLFGGALDFIYEAVRNIEWSKIIGKFVSGFNTFVKGMSDKLKEFVPKADEMGEIFATAITDLLDIDWPEFGKMIARGFNVVVTFLRSAIINLRNSAPQLGRNLADGIDAFIREVSWDEIGETINGLFVGAIDFVNALLDEFEKNNTATELGNKVSEMLGKIQWGSIATGVWEAIKKAFSAAGSFVDALFSEPIDYSRAEIDGAYLEKAMDFNAKPLGERMALKIKGVFEAIPWKDIAETTWKGIQEAFKVAGDFVATLLGAEEASPEAIGKAVGDKLGQIPWKSIFETLKETIMGFLNPMIKELLGSGNGRVFIAVSGALLLLKLGLGKLLTGAILGLGAPIAGALASLAATVGAAAAPVAGAIAAIYDVQKISEAAQGYKEAGDAYNKEVETAVGTLKSLYEQGKTDVAAQWAEMVYGVDIKGQELEEATKTVISAIDTAWSDAPKSLWEGFKAGWNTYFGEGGSGIIGLAQDGITQIREWLGLEGEGAGETYWGGFRTRIIETDDVSNEMSRAFAEIFESVDYPGGGADASEYFYKGFMDAIIVNGEVKEQYKQAVNAIFGTVDTEELGKLSIGDFYAALNTGAVDGQGKMTDDFKNIMHGIYNSYNSTENGNKLAEDLFSAFKTKIMDNGSVKKEYKAAFEEIFGSVDGLEDGSMTAQQFFDGWNQGVTDNKTPAQEAIVGAFEDAIKDVNSTLGIASPSTVAAEIAKYFLEGFAQGAEDNQDATKNRVSTVFKTISDAISGVVSGVKNFFSKILGGGKKDADTGVSADDIAKPYEDGAKRAETALDGLKKNTATALGGIKTSVQELEKTFTDALNTVLELGNKNLPELQRLFENTLKAINDKSTKTFSDVKTYLVKILPEIKRVISTALNDIKKDSSDKLSDIYRNVVSNTGKIKSDVSTKLKDTKDKAVTLADEMKTGVTKRFDDLYTNFTNDADSIQTKAESAFVSAKSYVDSFSDSSNLARDTFDSLARTAVDGVNDIESAASDFSSINTTMYNALSDTYTSLSNYDFSGIGSGIISGIITGINNGWEWLRNTVQALAQAAYKAAKAALGINSPSRVFRDGVGKQMIAGMEVGMEQAEPNMLKTIGNIAQNAADEMAGSQITANVGVVSSGIVDGIDDVLTRFSDKVTNSFTSLVDKLNAIAETVAFREPNVAAGTVLPYNVSANSTGDHRGNSDSERASHEDLISSMIQLVNNQTSALVQAIQQYGGTTVNLDARSLTDAIVDEINRRTRTNGRSPLIS